MKTVLFLIPTLTGGGAERVIVTLLRHLDRSRFQLTLAVVDSRQAVFRGDVPDDVEFIDLGCTRVRQALPKIIRLIWRRRPDVVFSTLGHLNLALAMLRPLLPRQTRHVARETIVLSHNLPSLSWPSAWAFAYRHFYGRVDRLICQSDDMRTDLVDGFGFPATRAVLIHNPVDVPRIQMLARQAIGMDAAWSSAPLRLVAAGRLHPQKGFDVLIEALARLDRSDWRLLLLGEGESRGELENLARKSGIAGRIDFAGFKPNPYPYFAHAHAFVLSSRYEGLPNVILEALACATPVIASPAPGGVRTLLQDVPGCRIAQDMSAAALAAELAAFMPGVSVPEAVLAPYAIAPILAAYERELLA